MLKSLVNIIKNSKSKINHSLIGLATGAMLYSGITGLPNKTNAENFNSTPTSQIEFKKSIIASDFNGASSVIAADLDNDGDLDVLGARYYANEVAYWENSDGKAQSWVKHSIDTNFVYPHYIQTADIDSDGDLDLLGAGGYPGGIIWWENIQNASNWPKHIVNDNFAGAISLDIKDMNNDGDLDIVGAASTADRISWFENIDGKGLSWIERIIGNNINGAFSTYAIDIDRDGDLDVLGAAQVTHNIIYWENTRGNSTAWSKHIVDDNLGWARCVTAADIDNDGIPDIIGASGRDNMIAWYKKNGENWIKNIAVDNFVGANYIYPADLDKDGDIDIVGTAYESNKISWFENISLLLNNGSAWFEHNLDNDFIKPHSAYIADLDGDTDLDILGAAHIGNQIAWWENQSLHPTPTPIPGGLIQILSPKAGNVWPGDSLQPLHWKTETNYAGTAVRFELWGENEWGNNERVGDLGYSWDPDGDAIDYVLVPLTWPETNYNVRVYSLWNPSLSARSDNFTITGNAVKVVSPRGNEIWPIGSMQYAHWEANREIAGTGVRFELWGGKSPNGKPGKVSDLELYAGDENNDLGVGWDLDGEDVNTFVVPQVAPGNYKIRAISTWNEKYYGESGPIKIVK